MKYLKILVNLLLFSTLTYAQPWSVNSADFEFSMNITGKIKIDDNFVNQLNSYVGAFVGEDCRGVVQATEVNADDFYFFLTIYSNSSSGEEVSFKFQDENDIETSFTTTVSFVADGIYGNPDNPFIWLSPDYTEATDFLFFSGDAQIGKTNIDTDLKTISLEVGTSVNINNLVTFFAVPSGTEVFVGTEQQQSGASQNNFSDPVIYTLKNGKAEQNWTVSILQVASVSDFLSQFYIYPNPTTGKITINFSKVSNFGKAATINISDISGKVIYNNKISILNNQLNIDLSEFGKGLYFIKIKNSEDIITKKLIVE